jgi:hypothetical protein
MATDLLELSDSFKSPQSNATDLLDISDSSESGDLLAISDKFKPEGGRAPDAERQFDPVEGKLTKGLTDEFVSGVSSGTDQLQASLFAVGRLAGRELGIDSLEDFADRGIDRNVAEAQLSKTTVQGFHEVEDMDSLLRWSAGALGNAVPSLALAVGSGGVAGVLGRRAVAGVIKKSLQDRISKQMIAKGFAKDQADAAAKRSMASESGFNMLKEAMANGVNAPLIQQGFTSGAMRGAFAGSALPQTGEAEQSLVEAGVGSGATAILAGAAGGALELLPNLRLISKLFPNVKREVSKAFIKDFAKGVGVQSVLEGTTEGGQEIIQLAALAYHDPAFDFLDPENIQQVTDSFAAGFLVGGFTGGAAEIPGAVRDRAPKVGAGRKLNIPFVNFNPREGKDPDTVKDFEPADNTLYQEVRERVHKVVEDSVGPAINRVASVFQSAADEVSESAPQLNEGVRTAAKNAKDAHNEFVEGHKHVLDDAVRFAREQAVFITEQAERLVGEERAAFIRDEMAKLSTQVVEIADVLKERADQIVDSVQSGIEGSGLGVFDEDATSLDVERETQFVFGKSTTRKDEQSSRNITELTEGEQAQTFKDRDTTGRRILKELRQRYPSATDSTFEIRQQEDGGYLVVLADSGQARALREDETVSKAIDEAVLSAARNPNTKRQAKVERKDPTNKKKGRKGRTAFDVPTLVFAGRRLNEDDSQTVEQGFAAMAGQLLDRGVINNEGFIELQRVFNELYPGKKAKQELTAEVEREGRISQLKEKLTDIPQSLLNTPEGQRIVAAQREELAALERDSTRPGEEAKTALDPRQDITEEVKIEGERTLEDENKLLDEQEEETKRRGRPTKQAPPKNKLQKNIDGLKRVLAKFPPVEERTAADNAEFKKISAALKLLQRPVRKGKSDAKPTPVQDKIDSLTEALEGLPPPDERTGVQKEIGDQLSSKLKKAVALKEATAASKQKAKPKRKAKREKSPNDSRRNIIARLEAKAKKEGKLSAEERKTLNRVKRELKESEKARKPKAKLERSGIAQGEELVATTETRLVFNMTKDLIKKLQEAQKTRKLSEREQQTLDALVREVERQNWRGTADDTGKPAVIPRPAPLGVNIDALNTNSDLAVVLPGASAKVTSAVTSLVKRISKLLSDGSKIRVINEDAARQMIRDGHPHADYAAMLLDIGFFAITTNVVDNDGLYYILVDDFANAGQSMGALVHEMGHALHFDTWESLSAKNQLALWNAFVDDVKSGKRTTGTKINLEGKNAEFENAQKNIFEFKEWMADQFVDWMNNRRQPKTALEKFLEAVATKMDKLREFITSNPGRFGNPNETYGQFVDSVATRIRRGDPTGTNQFFDNEGAAGVPLHLLFGENNAVGLNTILKDPGAPRGLKSAEWKQLKKRLTEQYPEIARRTALMVDFMANAYELAAAPATSVMRTLEQRVPSAGRLADMFNRSKQGTAKASKNYHQMVKKMQGKFMNKFDAIIPQKKGETKEAWEARKTELSKTLRKEGPPKTLQERQMRKLFDEVHAYLKESGLPIGKIENYFPRIFSREKLIDNEARILTHLENAYKNTMTVEERAEQSERGAKDAKSFARSFYNSLISQEADSAAAMRELHADKLSMQAPSFRNMRSRTAGDPFFNEFFEDNLDAIVGNYVTSAVKRAEYNNFLGEPANPTLTGGDTIPQRQWDSRATIRQILRDAKAEGATAKDLKNMKNYVDANLGMYGRDMVSPEFLEKNPRTGALIKENAARIRTVMASIVAYNNMRVLLFTVFASLPDLVGPAIRSNDLKLAYRTTINNIKSITTNKNDLAEMARAFGQISNAANQHIMTEYVDNHFMPPTLRKMNNAFFKWTGLNYWTDATRKMALAVGIASLKSEANKALDNTLTQKQRDRAKQFLKEFDLTPGQVKQWVIEGERTWGGIGYDADSKNDQAVSEALVQFVDESIMSPNASQRPILASHPAAMLMYHLKGFIYAMNDIYLKRIVHNFNISNETPMQHLTVIPPVLLMFALTALGLELREIVTRDNRTDTMDGLEYAATVVERSGLLGLAQFGFDFEGAGARGQSELAALSGPAIGQLADLISKPLSQTIPKAIPVVSQLPWARDALRGN